MHFLGGVGDFLGVVSFVFNVDNIILCQKLNSEQRPRPQRVGGLEDIVGIQNKITKLQKAKTPELYFKKLNLSKQFFFHGILPRQYTYTLRVSMYLHVLYREPYAFMLLFPGSSIGTTYLFVSYIDTYELTRTPETQLQFFSVLLVYFRGGGSQDSGIYNIVSSNIYFIFFLKFETFSF